MSDLNRINTASVEIELKALGEIVRAQQVRIDGLVAAVSGLQERLNAQEQSFNILRMRLVGTGASVK